MCRCLDLDQLFEKAAKEVVGRRGDVAAASRAGINVLSFWRRFAGGARFFFGEGCVSAIGLNAPSAPASFHQ